MPNTDMPMRISVINARFEGEPPSLSPHTFVQAALGISTDLSSTDPDYSLESKNWYTTEALFNNNNDGAAVHLGIAESLAVVHTVRSQLEALLNAVSFVGKLERVETRPRSHEYLDRFAEKHNTNPSRLIPETNGPGGVRSDRVAETTDEAVAMLKDSISKQTDFLDDVDTCLIYAAENEDMIRKRGLGTGVEIRRTGRPFTPAFWDRITREFNFKSVDVERQQQNAIMQILHRYDSVMPERDVA